LSVGQTNVMDFAVAAGAPPFRITWIRTVTDSPFSGYSISALPVLVSPGRSNLTMGVFSADLPTSDATLTLSGDGVTVGPTDFQPNTSFNNGALILNGLTATLSIASNAAPGLRSFIVTRTSDNAKAYAQGFLEILSQVIDYNFDGLDDRFQRQYFPLFTAPEAGPDADPDHDGYSNRAENVAGTNPTNAASLLRLESATTAANGTTIRWQSGAGRRYQVAARPALGSGSWQNLGAPVTATNALAEFLDAGATNRMNFYRVQALP
jgi:hypothetical protein